MNWKEEFPSTFLVFQIQLSTEKKTKEMKKKSLNKEPGFVANGCIFLEIKCKRKHVSLFRKVLAHLMTNHAKNVLGAKAAHIPFKKKKTSQVDINVNQLQKRIHCKFTKNTTL